jgi:DNA-binding IclR family transcriptional regulator
LGIVQLRGGRLPPRSTGVGLVLLAFADSGFQEALLARPLTHLPVDPAELRRRLADVRRAEPAVVRRNEPEPLVAVAASLRGADDEVASARAISCGLGAPGAIGLPPPAQKRADLRATTR